MKVLHILNAFAQGGMENGVANLSNHLKSRGIESDICVLTASDTFASRLPPSTQVFELDRGEGFNFTIWGRIRTLINENNYDVVHTHNWTGLIYGLLPALLEGVPVVHGEHTELFDWERTKWRLAVRRFAFRLCNLVHVLSKGQRADLKRMGLINGVRFEVIPNGTDTEKFRQGDSGEARRELGLPEAGCFLGVVGRFVETKRQLFMLDVFQIAASSNATLRLVLVGKGGHLEEQVRSRSLTHPFSDRIHWMGLRDDMPIVYRALNLMVVPSVNEGMSNAVLEAMACGVCVVANRACGMSEIICDGQDGCLFEMSNVENVAEKILDLVVNEVLRDKLRLAARRKIVDQFALTGMLRRYESLYLNVCKRGGR